jgi:hypothetical protein
VRARSLSTLTWAENKKEEIFQFVEEELFLEEIKERIQFKRSSSLSLKTFEPKFNFISLTFDV